MAGDNYLLTPWLRLGSAAWLPSLVTCRLLLSYREIHLLSYRDTAWDWKVAFEATMEPDLRATSPMAPDWSLESDRFLIRLRIQSRLGCIELYSWSSSDSNWLCVFCFLTSSVVIVFWKSVTTCSVLGKIRVRPKLSVEEVHGNTVRYQILNSNEIVHKCLIIHNKFAILNFINEKVRSESLSIGI